MTKHPGGRPTSYLKKHLLFAKSYLTIYEELGDTVPTIEGLADELHTTKKTLYSWGEKDEEFLHALEAIKNKQGRLLQSKGLAGKTQPVITKLMLAANHGMADKSDVTSAGEKITGISVEFIRPHDHQDPVS